MGTLLKRRNLLIISFVALYFICGCGHFTPKESKLEKSKLKAPDTLSPVMTDDETDEMTGPVEPAGRNEVENTASTKETAPVDSDTDALPDAENLAATQMAAATPAPPEDDPLSARDASAKDNEGQSLLDEALDFCEVAQSSWQKGELENALEALDKAYSLILGVDTLQSAKLIQQKEDLRFLISKRILEIYASRNIVVNGNHNEIPMEMNKHIENELKRFTGSEKKYINKALQRSGQYRPFIVDALKEAGLPEELSWLPLIESNFKVKALSRARALGLWQFIPSTGYKFGLKRNQYVDERIDFEKSTHAAIAYLKELHSIFGDWATVLAAYNCGEGRVLKVIRTQNVNYLDNFWDLYQRLPLETARYVPRFYATLHIVQNPELYGFDHVAIDPPLQFDTLEINRQVHLKDISKATGIALADLKALNPELRYHIVPAEPYTLRIPKGHEEDLAAKLDTIPTSRIPRHEYVWHRVRRGQTLSTIARRYRTSVRKIMRANNLRSSHMIRAGQRLKIPQRGYVVTRTVPVKRAAIPASGTHYVRKGDSLWIIAKRYGTTVQKIKSLNSLSSSHLYIGQALKIPGFKSKPLPDTAQFNTYSVQRGDSPFTIAQKHKMQLARLLMINRLTPNSKIFPGQKLFIE